MIFPNSLSGGREKPIYESFLEAQGLARAAEEQPQEYVEDMVFTNLQKSLQKTLDDYDDYLSFQPTASEREIKSIIQILKSCIHCGRSTGNCKCFTNDKNSKTFPRFCSACLSLDKRGQWLSLL